jgi:hypothetical protein
MTGLGVYALKDGGLYDSSLSLYYPDRLDGIGVRKVRRMAGSTTAHSASTIQTGEIVLVLER